MTSSLLSTIDVAERVALLFPFGAEIEIGDAIAAAQMVVTIRAGQDATPQLLLYGAPQIVGGGTQVVHLVQGRVAPVTYKIKCLATMQSGRVLARTVILPVVDF